MPTRPCLVELDHRQARAQAHLVISALLEHVLDRNIIRDAVDAAVQMLNGSTEPRAQVDAIETELSKVLFERDRLAAAIATGGQLGARFSATGKRTTEAGPGGPARRARSQKRLKASEANRARRELLALADNWCHVLTDDPQHARPIVSSLLNGRVTITPTGKQQWLLSGEGTLAGLFTREIVEGTDFQEEWRARRELHPRGIRFCRQFRAA